MSERFEGLRKLPKDPAARLLALANLRLEAPVRAPASASVPVVLAELDAGGRTIDMLKVMAAALPPRERAWWACLAARDVIAAAGLSAPPPALAAAEAWVFKPGDDHREAARAALSSGDAEDDTKLCAMTVAFFDGTLGPGELARMSAAPGAAQSAALGMNVMALHAMGGDVMSNAGMLVDRALDIARGGNGRVGSAAAAAAAGPAEQSGQALE